MERLISFGGLFVMMFLAWLMSSRRSRVPWRIIASGLTLQFVLAAIVFRTEPGQQFFTVLGDAFLGMLNFVESGSAIVFALPGEGGRPNLSLLRSFAFGTLPTIIFFASLMGILYHLGVMQRCVQTAAFVMRKTMRLSGAESLAVAANVFFGQVEAPLVVRPYLAGMTQSELMTIMQAGFATIAGGVMAAYVQMGIDARHLITASVVSAPAAVVIAKIMQPEVEEPATSGISAAAIESPSINLIDAAASGALLGLQLALQIGAIIIAFLALIAMCEYLFQWAASLVGLELTLRGVLGWLFAPLAWLMGIEAADCRIAGELLGVRTISNEFIAYQELGILLKDSEAQLSPRTVTLLTYALCGFANFGSIGVQISGIGAAAPARQHDLARLGMRAMAGGMLACFMTACVAGVLL
jgi:CNT family concentrative nucleoside transporter